MVESLVFHAFSAIFNKSSQLYREAAAIPCKKQRQKHKRKLRSHPTVRMLRVISSAAGYECGSPRDLTTDELLLQHVLHATPHMKLELRNFDRRVLRLARDDEQFERRWRRLNDSGNQHPEAYPYPDEADEVRRELDFRASDDYAEMGKTYSWYLHRPYGEKPSFADSLVHGECRDCGVGLPVWRSCVYCAFAHLIDGPEGIYVRCMECRWDGHQRDLTEVTKCQDCGGPPLLDVSLPECDSTPWMVDESWE